MFGEDGARRKWQKPTYRFGEELRTVREEVGRMILRRAPVVVASCVGALPPTMWALCLQLSPAGSKLYAGVVAGGPAGVRAGVGAGEEAVWPI